MKFADFLQRETETLRSASNELLVETKAKVLVEQGLPNKGQVPDQVYARAKERIDCEEKKRILELEKMLARNEPLRVAFLEAREQIRKTVTENSPSSNKNIDVAALKNAEKRLEIDRTTNALSPEARTLYDSMLEQAYAAVRKAKEEGKI